MQYYFGVSCIGCLFMLQNIFSHIYIKKFLTDTHTKIWTKITDIIIFRKKLLKFLQGCVELIVWIIVMTTRRRNIKHFRLFNFGKNRRYVQFVLDQVIYMTTKISDYSDYCPQTDPNQTKLINYDKVDLILDNNWSNSDICLS